MTKKSIIKFKKELTVVILCGGKGLRLRPITKEIPKPLVKVKNKSILENIIRYFLKFNVNDFIIATGYKHKIIDKFIRKKFKNSNIRTFYTGINSDIVERINKSTKLSKKNMLICYGDTLIDIDLDNYIKFFQKNVNKITVASYQLKTGFGIFELQNKNQIVDFKEKPVLDIWFNVGYFFISKNNFKYLNKFKKFKELLMYLSKKKIMKTFKHHGNHVTINTLAELEKAKKISVNFIK